MKRLKYILSSLVLGALAVTSCDVLDEQIVSGITDEYYETPEGFEDAVRAAYERLRWRPSEQSFKLSEYGTDAMTHAGHGNDHDFARYGSGLNPDNGQLAGLWNGHYQAINTTNTVVERATNADISEDRKTVLVGEIRFLRAFYYFDLIRQFDRIHLSLEETKGVETTANIVDGGPVYAAIIEDLEYAVTYLPTTQSEYGRVTKPAAEMLLAHVLLTRGQSEFAQPTDLQRVVDLADAVIAYEHLELLDNYYELWSDGTLNNQGTELAMGTNTAIRRNAEVVFSVQYSSDQLNNGGGNPSHVFFRPWYENTHPALERIHEPGYGRPWIRYSPTQWALDNFRYKNENLDNDSRYRDMFQEVWYYNREHSAKEGAAVGDTAIWVTNQALSQDDIIAITDRLPGVRLYTWNNSMLQSQGGSLTPSEARHHSIALNQFPYIKKHDDWTRLAVNDMDGRMDFYVYRLAEAYLFAAEAYVAMDSPAEAVPYLNAVRERAAYPGSEEAMAITAADVDMDFILDERSRELFAEGKRWYDLKRTGKLIERVTNLAEMGAGSGNYGGALAPPIQAHHVRRPIPQSAIDQTVDTVIEQNDGY